jgi:hypothetical protein
MTLLAAVQDFANGRPLRDDVSLTVIQRDASDAGRVSPVNSERWDWRIFHQRR